MSNLHNRYNFVTLLARQLMIRATHVRGLVETFSLIGL